MDVNGFKIKLPIGLKQVLFTPVRDSYQDFLQQDDKLVRRHLTALTTLLPKHLERPSRVLHVFGGVGATAQVIDQASGYGADHEFWERDPILVEYLQQEYPHLVVRQVGDSYLHLVNLDVRILAKFDHIMFDPSVATIKTKYLKACWAKMVEAQPRLVWLSDTACAKIHINAKYYEKDFHQPVIPTAEGYLQAYDHWLRCKHSYRICDAMREAAETYCVVKPLPGDSFPQPIPYL